MNTTWISAWFWPAILIAFLSGVQIARWWLATRSKSAGKVNSEYFKGLNFLLNEEPDKAIEVFIKALEVDSETVELHLALGGLFRRKGQVDRATRIHQNLIARPSLTEEQRLQAIYELAQDYYKAGLLDRAEDLFVELKEATSYRQQALEGLCNIYQQEKEWAQAIEVTRLHKRADRQSYMTRIAHYWCEIAEQAIAEERFDDAKRNLRNALGVDRGLARAVLLRGELHCQQKEYRKALALWESMAISHSMLTTIVIEKVIYCFEKLDDQAGLGRFLKETALIPREPAAFNAWFKALNQLFGASKAQKLLFERVSSEGLSSQVARYLYELSHNDIPGGNLETDELSSQLLGLVQDLLASAKERQIEYTCQRCGFDTRSHYWLCPNCGEWDSFTV